MKKTYVLLIILLLLVGGATIGYSLKKPDDDPTRRVRVQLQWFDQAQFLGLYVAQKNGYFRDEGLEVNLMPGGYAVQPIRIVSQGQADIGIVTADQLVINNAQRQDLKVFGTVFASSAACFITKKDSKLTTPKDLVGHKVGVYRNYDTEHLLLAMLARHGIKPESVSIVDAANIEAFINGELDAFPSYIFNEPHIMESQNIPINVIRPQDFGIESYSDTFFTTEAYAKANHDLLVAFSRATMRGWRYAKDHPGESVDIMYTIADTLIPNPMTKARAHQLKMAHSVVSMLNAVDGHPALRMEPARWTAIEGWLRAIGRMDGTGTVNTLVDYSVANDALR